MGKGQIDATAYGQQNQMEPQHHKALEIFSPYYLAKVQNIATDGIRFIQYTSAEAAMGIIKNQEVWLRNITCMNDYSEVEHGLKCLLKAFHSEHAGRDFKALLNSIFPDIIDEFINIFDSWLPWLKTNTYIACVSEHPVTENKYGRLSMWRAYGGDRPVALLLNKEPFLAETDVFHAYSSPVAYLDPDEFSKEFNDLSLRIENHRDFISKLGRAKVIGYMFDFFKNSVLCVKHPGFKEEQEWRVVYNPEHKKSQFVSSEIVSIDRIPQEIHKIPLVDIPKHGFTGATINDFIHKIIIGPCDQQNILGQTFVKLLRDAGCENAHTKIHYSGIPLR